MQRNTQRNMQEKMKEIFQTIHGKDRKTMEEKVHACEESWTLAPQKSLVEMVNGVWKPPKVLVVSSSSSPPPPTNVFAKWV